jgi:hypothetical protein
MAAKMADFMQKYVYLNNAGYNEDIFHILTAKVLFYIKAQTRVSSLKRWMGLFVASRLSKWRPIWRPKLKVNISQLLDKIAASLQRISLILWVQEFSRATANTAR